MKAWPVRLVLTVSLLNLVTGAATAVKAAQLPVRGLYLSVPKPVEVPMVVEFIRKVLPKERVNLLVMEINYRYQYTSHPEVVDKDALSREDVKAIVAACRATGVRMIPLINLFGHQSWERTTFGLLRAYPEFDETPGKYPNNEGIYCRSYCPLHPELHKVVFALMDELAEVSEADAVHVGLDEVFILADPDCPRCQGRDPAELFAQEVRALRDHLARSNHEMWMWGDRLLDASVTGLGKWEASANGTAPAIRQIPRDIVICDWHYDSAPPTAAYFAVEGFRVVSAPWRKTPAALGQLEIMGSARRNANEVIAQRMLGMLQTTWGSSASFIRAYKKDKQTPESSREAAVTFKRLFKGIRTMR
jgi:hypothetical protein